MVSARRIYSDFKVFSRGFMRNKFGLFFGLIFPVVLILIFGAIFSGGGSGTNTVYAQNLDAGFGGQNMGNTFLTYLNESGTIQIITVDVAGDFGEYLANKSQSEGILIPENFSMDYLTGKQVNITVYSNPASSSSGIINGYVNGYANYFNLNYFPTKIQRHNPRNNRHKNSLCQYSANQIHRLPHPRPNRLLRPNQPHVLTRQHIQRLQEKQTLQTTLSNPTHQDGMADIKNPLVHRTNNRRFPLNVRRRHPRIRRTHHPLTTAHTLPNPRPHAIRILRHARRHSCQEP